MAEWREWRYGGKNGRIAEWQKWLHMYYLRQTHTDDNDDDDDDDTLIFYSIDGFKKTGIYSETGGATVGGKKHVRLLSQPPFSFLFCAKPKKKLF